MTTVVIPTRNEPGIAEIVHPIVQWGWDVIVADNSTDSTPIIAAAAGAKVTVSGPGLGPAYLSAWKKIPDDEPVVHFDAGGSWSLDDLFDLFGTSPYDDVLIGSRFVPHGEHRGPRQRRVLSRTAAGVSNFLSWRPKINDWTSGFRYYSPDARAAIRAHEFKATGHAWQIEALAVCLNAELRVGETGVVYKPSSSELDFGRMREALKVWGWMLCH